MWRYFGSRGSALHTNTHAAIVTCCCRKLVLWTASPVCTHGRETGDWREGGQPPHACDLRLSPKYVHWRVSGKLYTIVTYTRNMSYPRNTICGWLPWPFPRARRAICMNTAVSRQNCVCCPAQAFQVHTAGRRFSHPPAIDTNTTAVTVYTTSKKRRKNGHWQTHTYLVTCSHLTTHYNHDHTTAKSISIGLLNPPPQGRTTFSGTLWSPFDTHVICPNCWTRV